MSGIPQTGIKNWNSLFPNDFRTRQESSLFVKKLMAVAVSNIVFLRTLLPYDGFGTRKIDNLRLKILSESANYPEVMQIISWVKGCIEASEYRYLRRMMLGFHKEEENDDNAIESYDFHFYYNADEEAAVTCNDTGSARMGGSDRTKQSTLALLRTLTLLTREMEPLPPNCYMTMKLLYYDDVTPIDYQPYGFVAADCGKFTFPDAHVSINAGKVITEFHGLKIWVKTDRRKFEMIDDVSIKTESQPIQDNCMSSDLFASGSQASVHSDDLVIEISDIKFEDDTPAEVEICYSDMDMVNGTGEQDGRFIVVPDTNNAITRCPCGFPNDNAFMISCTKCEMLQHGCCFGITSEDDVPECHFCHICYEGDKELIDTRIREFYELPQDELHDLCFWRFILSSIYAVKTLSRSLLVKRLGVDKPRAIDIIAKLLEEGFLTFDDQKWIRFCSV